jgi:hypothetical protein
MPEYDLPVAPLCGMMPVGFPIFQGRVHDATPASKSAIMRLVTR